MTVPRPFNDPSKDLYFYEYFSVIWFVLSLLYWLPRVGKYFFVFASALILGCGYFALWMPIFAGQLIPLPMLYFAIPIIGTVLLMMIRKAPLGDILMLQVALAGGTFLLAIQRATMTDLFR